MLWLVPTGHKGTKFMENLVSIMSLACFRPVWKKQAHQSTENSDSNPLTLFHTKPLKKNTEILSHLYSLNTKCSYYRINHIFTVMSGDTQSKKQENKRLFYKVCAVSPPPPLQEKLLYVQVPLMWPKPEGKKFQKSWMNRDFNYKVKRDLLIKFLWQPWLSGWAGDEETCNHWHENVMFRVVFASFNIPCSKNVNRDHWPIMLGKRWTECSQMEHKIKRAGWSSLYTGRVCTPTLQI